DNAAGGGGGRIAIRVTERFDVDASLPIIQARGGRNAYFYPAEGVNYVDGGAGTIYLVRPGATNGELIVSAYDERFPATQHRAGGTPLSGTLNFDAITVGPRALARFDDAYTIPDASALKVDPTALVVGPNDLPQATVTSTTPAAGAQIAQSTSITTKFTATSPAGIARANTILSVQPADVVQKFASRPVSLAETTSTIAVPSSATTGDATLKVRVTDRAGRMFTTAPATFNVVTNVAPTITQFDVTPLSLYANHSVTVTAAATDDIGVTSLTLTANNGATVTPQNPVTNGPSMTRAFTVVIPSTVAGGSQVQLTLSALDAFPNRVATTDTKLIDILNDTIAPALTVTRPLQNEQFNEGAGATFPVQVTATDTEVAVKNVTALFEGQTYTLNPSNGVYSANLPVPSVDGIDPVEKPLTITAFDYQNNPQVSNFSIYIKPLQDPEAPAVAWACSSAGAMYPAGYEVRLRVSASAPAGSSITSVVISVDGQPALTTSSAGTGLWEAKWRIPAEATAGTSYTGRAKATTLGGKETTIPATFTVVAGTRLANATSTINANDTGFGPQTTYIVEGGGQLTIIGPRALKNLIILDSGVVIHQQQTSSDTLTVEKLYVGCDARIDNSAKGYFRLTGYPGIATPLDSSSGGHIGRGGTWSGNMTGATYGSIYKPVEKGMGGHSLDDNHPAWGGGTVRINASSAMVIDGFIRANGGENGTWGSGAGGSIWLTTSGVFSGGGSLEVRGGGDSNNRSGGGGGAIAIEYGSLAGTIANNLITRGGTSTAGNPGAAGSVYLKGPSSTYGDLIVDNRNVVTSFFTELPWLGSHPVASVNGASATLDEPKYIPEYNVGNWLKVVAPDGTVRGTWRIASVANDSGIIFPAYASFFTSDEKTYDGYLIYTEPGYTNLGANRKIIAAKYENGQWSYDQDDNQPFANFTPKATDRIFATFRKNNSNGIFEIKQLTCGLTCGSINGIQVAQMVSGIIWGNAYGRQYTSAEMYGVDTERHEFAFAYDSDGRGLAIVQRAPVITLQSEAGNPVVMQAGDQIRGLYRFDNVTIKGKAKVTSRDAVESVNAAVVESGATWSPGDPAGPVIDTAKVTFSKGKTGPIVNGTAGAVADPDGKVDVFIRNAAKPAPSRYPETETNGGFTTTRTATHLQFRNLYKGGTWGLSYMKQPVGEYGYVRFRLGTGTFATVGIADHYFHFPNGTNRWEVWVSNAYANSGFKNGNYTSATRFRLEKNGSTIRWYVDDVLQYERVVTNVTDGSVFHFSSATDWAAFEHVEYYSSELGVLGNAAATDGSFSIPVFGAPGAPVTISARDRHTLPGVSEDYAGAHAWPQTTGEISIGTIPADFGIASVTLPTTPVTGGRTATGTVTLLSAAGSDGALIYLSSNSASATVPASVTIPAGQTSATFTVTTAPVTGPATATISATWGGAAVTGTLQIQKDVDVPTVTITAPAANAQYTEGASNLINVKATIVDADSGVKSAYATLDGVQYPLTKDASPANSWSANVPSPYIDGTAQVTKEITVYGTDNNDNVGQSTPLPVRINPIIDGGVPTISWACSSDGAIYPAGYAARLRVTAVKPNATNTIQKVELTITDPLGASTTVNAPLIDSPNNLYEYTWTVPSAADGAVYHVRGTVTAVSGTTAFVDSDVTVAAGASELSANTTISATDTNYENKTVIVKEGVTVTIGGTHHFKRLSLLVNAKVLTVATTPATVDRLDITAEGVYVACGATIDGNGRGYAGYVSGKGRTYGNTTTGGSTHYSGGSHGGRGGWADNPSAEPYDSLYAPEWPGGAGTYDAASCDTCSAGGGVVRLHAPVISIDGKINVNGTTTSGGGGAGGAIFLDGNRVLGNGELHADGASPNPSWTGPGGGGRIAVHYAGAENFTLNRAKITAAGQAGGDASRKGASPGTIYFREVDASRNKVSDELIVTSTFDTPRDTPLVDLGRGTITAVNGATLTLSNPVPLGTEGSTLQIVDANDAVTASYAIVSTTSTTVTLRQTPSVQIGDRYRGAQNIDRITTSRVTVSTAALRGENVTVAGWIDTLEVRAKNLTLTSAGWLAQTATTTTTVNRLDVGVTDTLTVNSGGVLDAKGRGLTGYVNGAGRTWPNTTTGGSSMYSGGSHGGRGGRADNEPAATYGSAFDPNTPGGSGAYLSETCDTCSVGGGVLRIKAKTIVDNGSIRVDGYSSRGGGGAGGSIRIDTESISGSGEVTANGAAANPSWTGPGAGGRIAIYYRNSDGMGLSRTKVTAFGPSGDSSWKHAAAGTIYFREADANGNKVTDELYLQNSTYQWGGGAQIVDLGTGTVVGVSGNVITLSATVPEGVIGSAIEILTPAGAVLSTYEILASSGNSVTVRLAAGESAPNAPIGSPYRGLWTIDRINAGNKAYLGGKIFRTNNLTLTGNIEVEELYARNLTLQSGQLTQRPASTAELYRLQINVEDTLTVDASSYISAEGKGFVGYASGKGRTWPNTTAGGSTHYSGGSHGGRGGWADQPSNEPYGSIFDPNEWGASGTYDASTCDTCSPGGGVIRIRAKNLVLNGKVNANALVSGTGAGGAGGSIRIDVTNLTGFGEIRANGAAPNPSWTGPGGGGRIAIYYAGPFSFNRASISAYGAPAGDVARKHAGPGTIYLRELDTAGAKVSDELIVDNDNIFSDRDTPLPAAGGGTITQVVAPNRVVDSAANFFGPNFLTGIRLFVRNDPSVTWPIVANDATSLTIDPAAGALTAQVGDLYRGVTKVDKLTLKNARLVSNDLIQWTTKSQDTASTIVFNTAAPQFDAAKLQSIVLESDATGHYVRGPIGTISDDDKPVVMTATNVRSGVTYTANAATDGSFSVKVDGINNDVFKLYATDSHAKPLRSRVVDVNGALGANSVQSLTLAPATVGGGTLSRGTVTLALPAGTSGQVVNLSSNSSYAVVPATITVAASTTSLQFDITTTEPPANVDAIISATVGASTRTATLTVTRDTTGPSVTVTAPTAGTQYNEGSATLINVRATVVDDFSGIKRVYATIDGRSTDLTKDNSQPSLYTGNVPAPFIDGDQNVTRDLTVTGIDGRDNATTSAAVSLVIKPVVDPNAPTLAWSCSSDAIDPVGDTAKLRVIAKAPNANNYIAKVDVYLTDNAGVVTSLVAAPVSGVTDAWEAAFIVPDVADGSFYTTRVVATTAGGPTAQVNGSLTVIKGGVELTGNTTISDTNTSFDNKSLIIRSGTTTLAGKHTFVRIAVLEGARLDHASMGKVDIAATAIYVACGGSIDVTGRGYGNSATYPGALAPHQWTGGSHIGRPGIEPSAGATFGSVERPQEHGGGPYSSPNSGGGVVRLDVTATVSVDGAIRANGIGTNIPTDGRSGGGGSVWITAQKISGAGSIEARAGDAYHEAGGGGAISIAYTDASSRVPATLTRGGTTMRTDPGIIFVGGTGSVFIKGPSSAYGDLFIDNAGFNSFQTELPSLGSGTAQPGSGGITLVTNRPANIPDYFKGHWVEIRNGSTLKGTWRIATINVKTVTLAPNGNETIDVQQGDAWQGVYRFDNVSVSNSAILESADPIRTLQSATLAGPTAGGVETRIRQNIDAPVVTIRGRVAAKAITAPASLTVDSNAVLTHEPLEILNIRTGTFTLNGTIDVGGRGYGNSATYPGALAPHQWTGGSHIGRPGIETSSGATFGSVERPQEHGGGPYSSPLAGGGVVRIDATEVIANGPIYANGVGTTSPTDGRSGGGGSIWITTQKISGVGPIQARAGDAYHEAGGGGAISIAYTDANSVIPALLNRGGTTLRTDPGVVFIGGAGSILVRGPSSTYGDL
ncbi:MAG TPA: Ig-like domain-containing protein, partial [Thermoanaerobaculia bacterium]|nr:Ig-like domain-containing protein [Thermoanaerobaculia bacterium]